jgi:hypothetical protein
MVHDAEAAVAGDRAMTIDHPLRRALARICSDETMRRIVDPVLGDVAWEQHRPRWRGYFDLGKALAVHAAMSTPRVIAQAARDDGYAMPRAAAIAMMIAFITAIVLVGVPHLGLVRRHGTAMADVFVLPGALAATLPGALLIAIPLALKGFRPSVRTRRHVVALALMQTALLVALIGWVVPEANQVYRIRTSGNPQISRGLNEIPLPGLGRQIELLKSSGDEMLIRRAEFGYHARLAMTMTALPLSIIALAIAWSRAGRRRPLLAGLAAFAIYLVLIPPMQQAIYVEMNRQVSWPVIVLAWAPQVLLGLFALSCYRIVNATPTNPCTTLPPPGSSNERIS